MDLQEHSRLGADRIAVVVQMRAVGRAHLAQPRAARGHDLRNAKRPADLDELASRDDHLAPRREGVDRQEQGRRGVVHDVRGFRPREQPEQLRDPGRPRAALPGLEVELEIAVARGRLDQALERSTGERRAAEIRVQDHARRVQDPARERRLEASRAEADLLGKRPELACRFGRAPKERRSRLFQHLASGGEQAPTSRSGSRSGRFDQPVDRRQGAKPWIDRPSALIYGHK